MNKIMNIIIALVLILMACMIGLMVTGYEIGWGPFAKLRYWNQHCYRISEQAYSYDTIPKTIQGANGTIRGKLYLADTRDESKQLVILSHGLGTAMWHNIDTAVSLANAGISVFMFDYCGGSPQSTSDRETTEMSILTEKQDLHDVIDEVKTWDFVDPNRIGIIGYSQGGLVAAMTVAERQDVDRLCLVYPAFSMYDEIKGDYPSVEAIPDTVERNGIQTGKIYYADIVTFPTEDIIGYCAVYEGDTLFIHGTCDVLVPYEYSVKANAVYPNSRLVTIEGAGHGFKGEEDITAIQAEYDFFARR